MVKSRSFIGQTLRFALWAVALAAFVYLVTLPDVTGLKKHNPRRTALMDLREKQARAKGRRLVAIQTWRPIDQISPNLVHAVMLAEDDTFYRHSGFDFEQIAEAVKINWQRKRWAYGGSTITQQLARTMYLSPSKNLLRKAKEALITIQLERHLSKKRILEIYLNVVEWGKGIYGAEAASQAYFGKGADQLTPDEAVALASILPSPRRWSPASEKAFMARRRTQLLERMQKAGYAPAESTGLDTAVYDSNQLFIGSEVNIPPASN